MVGTVWRWNFSVDCILDKSLCYFMLFFYIPPTCIHPPPSDHGPASSPTLSRSQEDNQGPGPGKAPLHTASVKCLYVLLLILHSIHCFPESMSGRVQEFLWHSIKCRSKGDPSPQLIRHLWPTNWGLILRFITHVVTKQIIRMSLLMQIRVIMRFATSYSHNCQFVFTASSSPADNVHFC